MAIDHSARTTETRLEGAFALSSAICISPAACRKRKNTGNHRDNRGERHRREGQSQTVGERGYLATLVTASAELELAFGNLQGFDFGFKSRWRNSKLGRRS